MPIALLSYMTKSKTASALFASTVALVGFGQAACMSDDNVSGPPTFDQPGWVTDKSKFMEEWVVSGYARPYDYCRDGKAKSPRIVQIVTTGQSGLNTQLYAEIAGCTSDNVVNYRGYISGEVIEDPSEPNTWFVSGDGGAWAILADGTTAQAEDHNAVWAIEFTERNTVCLGEHNGDSVETATRDVTLLPPGINYSSERLLRQLRPSTLDGTRYTSCD